MTDEKLARQTADLIDYVTKKFELTLTELAAELRTNKQTLYSYRNRRARPKKPSKLMYYALIGYVAERKIAGTIPADTPAETE